MGKNSRQRHAAKLRSHAARRQTRGDETAPPSSSSSRGPQADRNGPSLNTVIVTAARFAYGPTESADRFDHAAAAALAADPTGDATQQITGQALVLLWAGGWQPADVVHLARRHFGGRVAQAATRAVLAEATVSGAAERAPQEWIDQLDEIGERPDDGAVGFDAAIAAIRFLGLILGQPKLPLLLPPPSNWGKTSVKRTPRANASGVDQKLLTKIRALLAKAEATTFAEEAESFSAKAQELMARYTIDAALLNVDTDSVIEVRGRRVHIDDPFATSKAQLLGAVAYANGGRVVYDQSHGFATVMAESFEHRLIEVLYTSLLVQATKASAAAAVAAGRTRTPSFRRAFLLSYAIRIGERLEVAQKDVQTQAVADHGSSFLPVLVRRDEAVAEAVRETFPNSAPIKTRKVDSQGWRAGRVAADLADLGKNRSELAG
jgi:hypothetical protein